MVMRNLKVLLVLILAFGFFLISSGGCGGTKVKKEDPVVVSSQTAPPLSLIFSNAFSKPDFSIEPGLKRVYSSSLNMDAMLMALGGSKKIEIWDLRKKRSRTITTEKRDFLALAVSPDGRFLASGSYQHLDLWDTEEVIHISGVKAHLDHIISIAFSPDGRLLATGSKGDDKTIRIWDTKDLKLLKTLEWDYSHAEYMSALGISNDGHYLASVSLDKTIKIWDLNSGALSKTLNINKGTILSLTFSPDGRYLAAGSADGSIMIWDARDLNPLRSMNRKEPGVTSLLFVGDGRYLVSGGLDRTMRLWDLEDGRMISDKRMGSAVESLSFSPDGLAVAAIIKGKANIFPFPPPAGYRWAQDCTPFTRICKGSDYHGITGEKRDNRSCAEFKRDKGDQD